MIFVLIRCLTIHYGEESVLARPTQGISMSSR
jgi:hypothetical protein